jgi:hypothetical protein
MPKTRPLFSLPKFAGRTPDGHTLKITGSTALQAAMSEGHDLDETIYLIVGCKVSKVGHELDSDQHVIRVETLKSSKLAILDLVEGEKLLAKKLADAGITLDV